MSHDTSRSQKLHSTSSRRFSLPLLLTLSVFFFIGGYFLLHFLPDPGPVDMQPISDEEQKAPALLPSRSLLHLEQLTWVEVRDFLLATPTPRILLPTGGIEQNGPYVALNKHDLISREVSVRAARLLGHTLVAPTISFVPEGSFTPPTGHMRYPGTVSLREETFEALLRDVISSFSVHGFKEVVLFGDSGGSQFGMERAALAAQATAPAGVRIRFVKEFYNYDEIRAFLRAKNLVEESPTTHEELAFSLQLLAISPESIRCDERIKAGLGALNGVSLAYPGLADLGERILNYRAALLAHIVDSTLPRPALL